MPIILVAKTIPDNFGVQYMDFLNILITKILR